MHSVGFGEPRPIKYPNQPMVLYKKDFDRMVEDGSLKVIESSGCNTNVHSNQNEDDKDNDEDNEEHDDTEHESEDDNEVEDHREAESNEEEDENDIEMNQGQDAQKKR